MIVSTVRTTSPGFLCMLNRMNVMLTRCNTGMVLVTNRRFVSDAGSGTLLGKLAWRWNASRDVWVDSLALSDRRASLPGAPAAVPRPSITVGPRPHPSTGSSAAAAMWAASAQHAVPRAVVAAAPALGRPAVDVSSPLFRRTPSSGSLFEPLEPHRLRSPTAVAVSQKLSAGLSAMRIGGEGGGSDAFPTLGGTMPKKVTAPLGRWRRGSEACKL